MLQLDCDFLARFKAKQQFQTFYDRKWSGGNGHNGTPLSPGG